MWFYGMLGTDEQRYYWMDEGFTSFAEDEAMNVVSGKNFPNAHLGYLGRYGRVAHEDWMEPASTLANYFDGKFPYQMAAYMKGSLFLVQLRGIVGEKAFWSTMKRYKNEWAFKHPRPENFLRIAEQESGMVLDWYMNQWIETNKVPDVASRQRLHDRWQFGQHSIVPKGLPRPPRGRRCGPQKQNHPPLHRALGRHVWREARQSRRGPLELHAKNVHFPSGRPRRSN
jgi:aminopeptidase N